MGSLHFALTVIVFLLGLCTATSFILGLFGILILFVMAMLVHYLYFYFKESMSKDKRPPIAGLVLNELVHFDKIIDYQTMLARKHSTFCPIAPSRSQIYTTDSVNVEYLLKTNFPNYIKVILATCSIHF